MFQVFNDPMETVENTILVLEYSKRDQEILEWQAYYHFGEAIQREVMRCPGDTYAQGGDRLGLTKHQTNIGVRVYQLFRDHAYAVEKLSGITVREIHAITRKRFDDTLKALCRDFPPPAIPDELFDLDEEEF
jgi:hypothetical protein